MNLTQAFAILSNLNRPFITTSDAALLLKITPQNSHKILSRLNKQGLVKKLYRSKWILATSQKSGFLKNYDLIEFLTHPFPSYLSLQSSLYFHNMIDQIPTITFVVSLAKTKKIKTDVGTYSIHHLAPEMFFGFELHGTYQIKIATPEKALIDIFYLSQAKSRLFCNLPELELPKSFSFKRAYKMARLIKSKSRQTRVIQKLTTLEKKQ